MVTTASKADLRRAARSVSAATPIESARVCEHVSRLLDRLSPRTALTYLAMPGEVDLGRLSADRPDIVWAVTRTPDAGWLTVHPLDSVRERHAYGFEQPVADAPQVSPEAIDAILVPGVAFDSGGVRLGRGKGYYDELLGRCRSDAVAIGITLERCMLGWIPSEPHDRRVDWLVTEAGPRRARSH